MTKAHCDPPDSSFVVMSSKYCRTACEASQHRLCTFGMLPPQLCYRPPAQMVQEKTPGSDASSKLSRSTITHKACWLQAQAIRQDYSAKRPSKLPHNSKTISHRANMLAWADRARTHPAWRTLWCCHPVPLAVRLCAEHMQSKGCGCTQNSAVSAEGDYNT